jgi:hypothetical protein
MIQSNSDVTNAFLDGMNKFSSKLFNNNTDWESTTTIALHILFLWFEKT